MVDQNPSDSLFAKFFLDAEVLNLRAITGHEVQEISFDGFLRRVKDDEDFSVIYGTLEGLPREEAKVLTVLVCKLYNVIERSILGV
jgi:hypothetical protein